MLDELSSLLDDPSYPKQKKFLAKIHAAVNDVFSTWKVDDFPSYRLHAMFKEIGGRLQVELFAPLETLPHNSHLGDPRPIDLSKGVAFQLQPCRQWNIMYHDFESLYCQEFDRDFKGFKSIAHVVF